MKTIPLVDLVSQYESIKEEIDPAIASVVSTAGFIGGPILRDFEEKYAEWCGVGHAVGCSSGTSATHLALAAHGIGPGDEVIVPSMTFIATAESVLHSGAECRFVDVDPETCCMDPEAVEAAINERTAAIVVVDLYGRLADYEALEKVARRHKLLLIEDAAQSHGARRGDRQSGGFGDIGTFSFYPGKNLGAYGDAGIVTTRDGEIAAKVRRLIDHGRMGKYEHSEIGYNYRLDALQAAVLRVKLNHIDGWNNRRRSAAGRYNDLLGGIDELSLPPLDEDGSSAWHLYVVRHAERDRLLDDLRNNNVGAGLHYPIPVHLQPAFEGHVDAVEGKYPVSEELGKTVLSLPLYPEISEESLQRVAGTVRESCGV